MEHKVIQKIEYDAIHHMGKDSLKFEGSILGVLIGDCLGRPYENERMLTKGERLALQIELDQMESVEYLESEKQYTDDTAMTISISQSLIEHRELNEVDVAKKFVRNFFREPHRGYGPAVATVFKKMKGSQFSDIYRPAAEQFDGAGSLGNGGAMRIAPIALFYQNDDRLIDMVRKVTLLTHTHKEGVNGAILQALAINQCLSARLNLFNPVEYVDALIKKMEAIETIDNENPNLAEEEARPYRYKLLWIKKRMECYSINNVISDEKVVKRLGHYVTALDSVPTAIYCFLRAHYPIVDIKTENPFRRAIQYAITLGGDTDTIASMTGALAGALYGADIVNESLLKHCEGYYNLRRISHLLYKISKSKEE